jgi:peptidoglycan/xylan/chitin deacetylase (PgdA/CDA1 family)
MSAQRIPVLLYHSVSEICDPRFAEWTVTPALFADQMRYLAENRYRTLTVRELAERVWERREPLDDRSVVITFDDGLLNFYTHAWPSLQRHSLSATLYVATGFVGRTSAWLADVGEGDQPMLNWSQIAELSRDGVEIGAHSHEHLQLDTLSAARAALEIRRSRDALQEVVGPVVSFAYPYGYYRRRLQRQIADEGFSSACSVRDALSSPDDDRFAFARAIVSGGTSVDDLERIICGDGIEVTPGAHTLRRGVWRVARRMGAEPIMERVRARRHNARAGEA